jgi:uncharacterized protein (TIGR00369 family)
MPTCAPSSQTQIELIHAAAHRQPGLVTETATEIWQEPVRGAMGDMRLLALPGIEQLRYFLGGPSAAPPVARLTGRRLVEVEPGRVVYSLPVTGWLVGPKGRLHPGVLSLLADAPLLAAVHTMLAPGTISTTAEVSTTFLDTAEEGDELRAEGRQIHTDKTTGLAEVFITRGDGKLIGHGTSRVFIFPPIPQDEPEDIPRPPEIHDDTPDPPLRPVRGGWVTPDDLVGSSGLELLQRQLAGELPQPPIDRLTGLRLTGAGDGWTTFALPTSAWLANEFGTVFGGMVALLASSAGSAAVQTIAAVGTPFTALDMKLNIIKPVQTDSGDLTARAQVVHRGRQLAIASTEIFDGREKRIAVATGSTMLGRRGAAGSA